MSDPSGTDPPRRAARTKPKARAAKGEARRVKSRPAKPARPLLLLPWLIAGLGVLVMGALARLSNWHRIVVDGEVLPMGGDEAYHLWRIVRMVRGDDAAFDPMINWPHGAVSLWSPGFDWLGAAWVGLLGADGDTFSIARAACLFPVVLGLAGILATMLVTRFLAGSRSGAPVLAAGIVIALMPRCISLGRMGRVDHHVAELLFVLLLIAWTLVAPDARRAASSSRLAILYEVSGGILLAGGVWTMSVGLIYAGLAAFVLLVLAPRRTTAGLAVVPTISGSGGPAFLLGGALLAALYAPLVAEHGHAVSYVFPSYFQPALFLVAGIALLAAGLVESRARTGPSEASALRVLAIRVGAGLGAAGACLALLGVMSPDTTQALLDGVTQYLATRDPWLATIVEIQPLLSLHDHPWNAPSRTWGPFGYALPVVAILGLRQAWRVSPVRAPRLAVWAAFLLLLALMQSRWSRAAVAIVAPLAGLALMSLGGLLERALAKRGITPWTRRFVTGALVVVSALTASSWITIEPLFAVRPPRPIGAVHLAARHLREHARAPEPGNRSGVLVRWDIAQTVLFVANRPIVSGGFGPFTGEDGFRAERRAWLGTPTELWDVLEERDLGYVVAGAGSFDGPVPGPRGERPFRRGDDGRGTLDPQYFKGVQLSPMILGGSAIPELGVRHLEHLMPRFASPEFSSAVDFPVPRFWVFEHVAGAELVGTAAPSTRVVVEVNLKHAAGIVPYRAFTDSDERGHYRLRIPLPTGLSIDQFSTGPRATVRLAGAAPKTVAIPEAAVRGGDRIVVAD